MHILFLITFCLNIIVEVEVDVDDREHSQFPFHPYKLKDDHNESSRQS